MGGLGLLLLAHSQSAGGEAVKLTSDTGKIYSAVSSSPASLQNSNPARLPQHDIADVSNSRLLQLAEV